MTLKMSGIHLEALIPAPRHVYILIHSNKMKAWLMLLDTPVISSYNESKGVFQVIYLSFLTFEVLHRTSESCTVVLR